MGLTSAQILLMAPDTASASNGQKLSHIKNWKSLGKNDVAIWGECQGSALYQVRVEQSGQGYKCSCPSRKFPCKHILALLLLYAQNPQNISENTPPAWVQEWLDRREKAEQRKEAKESSVKESAKSTIVSEKQLAEKQKRREERQKKILDGLEQLDLWLADLIRNGLANPQIQNPKFWADRAARMTDAQAQGIAGRLLRIGEIVGTGDGWEARVLGELGRLTLLTHAYRNSEKLPLKIKEDLAQMIGWTVQDEELQTQGEKFIDEWIFLGQQIESLEKLRCQRTWILGKQTKKVAMILQFSPERQPFKEVYFPGSSQKGEIVYYPSNYPLRAKLNTHIKGFDIYQGGISGHADIEQFLGHVAEIVSQSPWVDQFLCILQNVRIIFEASKKKWYVQDQNNQSLLLHNQNWPLLSIAGTNTVDIIGEWDSMQLTPFLVSTDQKNWQVLQTGGWAWELPF